MSEVEPNHVQVVRWVEEPDAPEPEPDSADTMGPASPRHARTRTGLWRRTITAGHEALAASSESIAVQVDAVAERMITALEQRQHDRHAHRAKLGLPDPAWEVGEIEVSFGVQLTGEATVAIFSGSAESSAQIVLKFSRT
jgi:hypothetical protein